MRFLLYPPSRTLLANSLTRHDAKRKKGQDLFQAAVAVNKNASPPNGGAPALVNDADDICNHVKSWGQQCAPHCGCVVRFETKIDPSSRKILHASYQAKTVVATSSRQGGLVPTYTTHGRPMFKECSCKTLHHLAKEISNFLPGHTVDQIKQLTDFSSSRSSTAFRHSVLAASGLPRNDTHCFDLMEEAFTAMIKGYMPRRRKDGETFHKSLLRKLSHHPSGGDVPEGEEKGNPKRVYGSDRTALSMGWGSSKSMSALNMLDINAEAWEHEQQQNQKYLAKQRQQLRRLSPQAFDWVTYVDELHQKNESA